MKQLASWSKWAGVGALAVVAIAGCTPQQDAAVDTTTDTAAQTTDNAMDSAAPAADNAVDASGNALTSAADWATITPQVKEALGDKNAALKGSSIDVDTDVTNSVVHLKGTVVDEAQKTLAEATAKKELDRLAPSTQYTIANELTVGAAPKM